MVSPADLTRLDDFVEDPDFYIRRFARTKRPGMLMKGMQAKLVIMSPAAYARLAKLAGDPFSVDAIKSGIADMNAGRYLPLDVVMKRIKARATRRAADRAAGKKPLPPHGQRRKRSSP